MKAKTSTRTNVNLLLIIVLIASLFAGTSLTAADRYSVASGDWSSTSTWSSTSGGGSGASVPGSADNIYLENGHTVTVTAAAACGMLTFTTTGASATLTINSGITLTDGGAVTLLCGASPSTINGSGTLALGGNVTVNYFASGSGSATIACPVSLGANRTITVADNGTSATDLTMSGMISGTGFSILKEGAGTLLLSNNNNSYTGGTTIGQNNLSDYGGTIEITNAGALGTGRVTVNTVASGGTLEINGSFTVSNLLTLNGQGAYPYGLISSSGTNTWSGNITIISQSGIGGSSSGFTISGNIDLGTHELTIGGGGAANNISGEITGTSGCYLRKVTAGGKWAISHANNGYFPNGSGYGTLVQAGYLIINDPAALGPAGNILDFGIGGAGDGGFDNNSGGFFITNDYDIRTAYDITFIGHYSLSFGNSTLDLGGGAPRKITINSNTLTLNGVVSVGALTKAGNGTLILSGANSYSGATTVSAGTLIAGADAPSGSAGAFGNASSSIIMGDAATTTNNSSPSLLTGGAFTVARAISVADHATSGTYSIGGHANNNSTFSGAITINQPLKITQVATTGMNTLSISGGITTANAGTKNLTFDDAGSVSVNATAITKGTGDMALIKQNSGALSLSTTNTYKAGTTLSAGTLNINNSQALGTVDGTFTINGGNIDNTSGGNITTLDYPLVFNGNVTYLGSIPRNLNLGSGNVILSSNPQITVSAGILTIGGTINDNTNSLTKLGSGALDFVSQAITLKNLTISLGTLTSTSATMSLVGDFLNSGTFTPNSGTVVFNGTGAQTIKGGSGSFNNFTITNTGGTCTASTNGITVTGTFTTSSGSTLNMASNALSVNTVSHAGYLLTQSVSATPISPDKAWGGTVEYNAATGGQSVVAGTFYDLIMGNTSGIQTVAGKIDVLNALDIRPGGNLTNPSGKVVTVGL
ncbi:MAG: autotransporter-associated beta strand repeat-containing protein [Bacteroidetes bacterium]|nr:autotransporter-associated beta strand repeat-containing protein [Bacteroidota bacterium]